MTSPNDPPLVALEVHPTKSASGSRGQHPNLTNKVDWLLHKLSSFGYGGASASAKDPHNRRVHSLDSSTFPLQRRQQQPVSFDNRPCSSRSTVSSSGHDDMMELVASRRRPRHSLHSTATAATTRTYCTSRSAADVDVDVTSKDPKEEEEQGSVSVPIIDHNDNALPFLSAKSLAMGRFDPKEGVVSLHRGGRGGIRKTVAAGCCSVHSPLPLHDLAHPFLKSGNAISVRPILVEDDKQSDKAGDKEAVGRGLLLESHCDYYEDPQHTIFLESGGVFFSFTCRTHLNDPYERNLMATVVNLSSFHDETQENCVPNFNVNDPLDLRGRYTFILQKSAYLLPGVSLQVLTVDLLSGVNYHKACQPKGTRIWDDVKEGDTFRMTKPIVRYLYDMTIQFKVSMVRHADLEVLSKLMGVRIDTGILMERTKRSKVPKVDFTAKAKSVLLYTAVPGGVLVTHVTAILNNSIPFVVAKVIDSLGSMGLRETVETAARTREYLLRVVAAAASAGGGGGSLELPRH